MTLEGLTEFLGGFVSEHKRQRIEQVLDNRTRHISVVLEDLFQPHNASAVLRSCECFGVQDVHIIENKNTYTLNSEVDQGASKWLSLIRYRGSGAPNTGNCLERLQAEGYRLVAASPHERDCSLDDLAVEQPLALMFGTEELGLSDEALSRADAFVHVPMVGFMESFNISVCVALVLRELTGRLRRSELDWQLSDAERRDLRLSWYRKIVRGCKLLEERFLADRETEGGG